MVSMVVGKSEEGGLVVGVEALCLFSGRGRGLERKRSLQRLAVCKES